MSSQIKTFAGGQVLDGGQLHNDKAARFENGVFARLVDSSEAPVGEVIDLHGDILSPGYVDLQVNGGGGFMFNDAPSVETLNTIAINHRKLGAIRIFPTLITDAPDVTRAAIQAACEAVSQGVAGIAGLHLEGPHLSVKKKGVHLAGHIRPMTDEDLNTLLEARENLPALMVTVAPENTRLDQVERLAAAGVLVSLGHTDADFETCMAYFEAGARSATHLFNAMSQLGSRAPGLVGATLHHLEASAGLIADGTHVHVASMRAAWHAKASAGIYLVSDAMACAGTSFDSFCLGERRIYRKNGVLRTSDGTLAGADLDLTQAISTMVNSVGVPLDAALRAATSVPSDLAGLKPAKLSPGLSKLCDVIRIKSDLSGAEPLEVSV